MPISTVIHLIPTKDAVVRPTMGRLAHAAFLSILQTGNPQRAEEIHAQPGLKPFTVSPLIGKSVPHGRDRRFPPGEPCWLRFTLLDDNLFPDFGAPFLTGETSSIRLDQATFQVSQFTVSNSETQRWAGNATYEVLIASATAENQIHLRFYSPTAFRQMSPAGQKRRSTVNIDLVRCYQSWISKWNAFAPMQIDKEPLLRFIENQSLLTRVEVQTRMLDFGRHKEIGFVGTCTYEFQTRESQSHSEMLHLVNLLADFALYCGTGYKTTMGMGQTRRF